MCVMDVVLLSSLESQVWIFFILRIYSLKMSMLYIYTCSGIYIHVHVDIIRTCAMCSMYTVCYMYGPAQPVWLTS